MEKRLFIIGLILVLISSPSCSTSGPNADEERMVQTTHFDIHWNTDDATEAEVAQAQQLAEERYAVLAHYFGEDKTPTGRLILRLDGDGLADPNQPQAPYVDGQGRIYLYRFETTGYFGELLHELVHAFRLRTNYWSQDGFIEEGLAEFVSTFLQPETVGFPRYGYSLDVVAGQWLYHEQAIPLSVLQSRHWELNLPCKWQAYPLRASFFQYLHETFGKEKVFALADAPPPVPLGQYEQVFGQSFEDLAQAWAANLTARFAAGDNMLTQAQAYRTQTPVQYAIQYDEVCTAG